ncbi:helix-turn-helix domain-containing protein [Paenibacillus sp. PDC88]|nr:helix-turn-helix domain-containing protein [Paenibacillus sp. PDC88]
MPLLEYDQKHNTLLYDTIRMYFKHSRNIKKTAAEMFAHYNTVAYRVEKAYDLLQVDPDNGDQVLQLQLAIKLNEMKPTSVRFHKLR